jgi:hypothetical protein
MRKTTKTAALAAALLMASGAAEAQDDVSQEAGPVELAPSAQFQGTNNAEATAAAQPVAGPLRVYGGLRLGVGGGIKPVSPAADVIATSPSTPTIQVGAEYLMHKYFGLGLETRLSWARSRDTDDRLMLWDLVLKPRSNYQLTSKPVELYAALPVGLSISNWPDEYGSTGKAGATLGLSGGANYFFNSHMGLNMEMGWLWHWIRDEFEAQTTEQETFRLGQWTVISANFLYAF